MFKILTQKPKTGLFLVFIFIAACFSRLYLIGTVPTSLSHDEMIYAINAKTISVTGSDTTGTWNPLSLSPFHPDFAELTAPLMSVFFHLPLSPTLAARLPFVIMSLIIPFLIAGITYELTHSRQAAIFSWAAALFNPWIWQMGRMSFDPYWSLFFYLGATYLLLKLPRYQKLLSIIPIFLGFYHYQGHKMVILFWIGLFTAYLVEPHIKKITLKTTKKLKKIRQESDWKKAMPPLIVFFFTFLLLCFYIFVQLPSHSSSERLETIFTPNSPRIAESVNKHRRLSLDHPLNELLINKYTEWAQEVTELFIATYSPDYLFLSLQAGNSAFSVWNHGIFYLADGILLAVGLFYLGKKDKKLLFLILGGLAAAVIPTLAAGSESFFFRSSLNIPLLLILIGIGAMHLYKTQAAVFKAAFFALYSLSILYFAFIYFVRYPVFASARHYFTDKILSSYLNRLPASQKVVIYTPEPNFTYTAYIFYNDLFTKDTADEIQKSYASKSYQLKNIQIINDCIPKNVYQANEIAITRFDALECDEEHTPKTNLLTFSPDKETTEQISFAAVKDSGGVYQVYNDLVCDKQSLPGYLHIKSMETFRINSLDDDDFCNKWLINL